MLNLLKFKERAEYPADYDGPEDTDVSGEEAYGRYGSNTMPHVAKRGGRLVLLSRRVVRLHRPPPGQRPGGGRRTGR